MSDVGSDVGVSGVRGGGVVHVDYAEVLRLSEVLAHAAAETVRRLPTCAGAVASPDLAASLALSPATALAAEATLGQALRCLTEWAAGAEVDAVLMRAAVDELAAADDLARLALASAVSDLAVVDVREYVAPVVTRTDLTVPLSATPPPDLTGLVAHLGQVSALSDGDHPEHKGTIEIQTVTAADGARRHIVYLPGTDDLNPFSVDGDVRDLAANARLEAGLPTAHGSGVLAAMRQAGIGPDEPVLLAGHSQGGMQAMAIAVAGSPYHVTDVVTAGSPAVPGRLPAGVRALGLEHQGDLIPLADGGAGSPGGPERVAVTFDSGIEISPLANHSLEHYVAGARAAQQSDQPVVQHAVHGIDAFLARPGDRVDSTVFQITRGSVLTGSGGRTP